MTENSPLSWRYHRGVFIGVIGVSALCFASFWRDHFLVSSRQFGGNAIDGGCGDPLWRGGVALDAARA